MRREESFTDQKSLNISSLHTNYLNLDSSSSGSSRHNDRAHYVHKKCTVCGLNNHSAEKCFKSIRQEKEKARAVDVLSNRNSDVRLGNALDVDLKITQSQNVPSHQKIMRNGEGKYLLIKR